MIASQRTAANNTKGQLGAKLSWILGTTVIVVITSFHQMNYFSGQQSNNLLTPSSRATSVVEVVTVQSARPARSGTHNSSPLLIRNKTTITTSTLDSKVPTYASYPKSNSTLIVSPSAKSLAEGGAKGGGGGDNEPELLVQQLRNENSALRAQLEEYHLRNENSALRAQLEEYQKRDAPPPSNVTPAAEPSSPPDPVPELAPVPRFVDLLKNDTIHVSKYPKSDIRSIYDGANINATGLQPWLKEYLQWHSEMRQKFPGPLLLDHPDAPKILIKVCLGPKAHRWGPGCDGLHDRFRPLPDSVYMAAQTKRVLLYKWMHPYPLEEFLQPNFIDWTVPDSATLPMSHQAEYLRFKHIPRMTRRRDMNTFQRLRDDPNFSEQKVVTFTKLEGEAYIEEDRQKKGIPEAEGEFGSLFHLLFKPVPAVETELVRFMKQKRLAVNKYVATHCRVTHPSRIDLLENSSVFTSKNDTQEPDAAGLVFEGKTKDMMIDVATHAIRCADQLRVNNFEPIYFFSDSDDLVSYMAAPTTTGNISNHNDKVGGTLSHRSSGGNSRGKDDSRGGSLSERRSKMIKNSIKPGRIVGRDLTKQGTIHLDQGQGTDVTSFYGTFLDLYIGVAARCVSFGIGNYAYLGILISNTKCLQTHERLPPRTAKRWGTDLSKIKGEICPIPKFNGL